MFIWFVVGVVTFSRKHTSTIRYTDAPPPKPTTRHPTHRPRGPVIKTIGEVTIKVELPVPQLLQAGAKGKTTEVRVLDWDYVGLRSQ